MKKKYIVLSLIVGLMVVILGVFGYEYHQIQTTANTISNNHSKVDQEHLKQGRPFSILVLGTDVGALGRGTEYVGNTDTMELITVNPAKQQILMTAIPRDTLVRVKTKKKTTYTKINAVYALSGASGVKKQVSELLNVPVDYYALINMGALEKVVTAVGGVEVNNPFSFTYEGHKYPRGKQFLNGKEALGYSRMRYDDPDNDYGRQKRGQQVLLSALQKVGKSKNIIQINNLLSITKGNVQTDLPLDDLRILYKNYHSALNKSEDDHLQGKNATIDGLSFQIAPKSEIQRLSNKIRQSLDLKKVKVDNIEIKMNEIQTSWNGYDNVNYVLPGNAKAYVPIYKS